MNKIIKKCILLLLIIIAVVLITNTKTNKNNNINADTELVEVKDDSGNTVYYRNTTTPVMKLKEYNYPNQELRACWVSNFISSLPAYSTEAKWKSDFSNVLDVMETYGLNCIIFHARTHNNALYKSKLNPIATFFQKVDFDTFDPLAWAIEETHSRGIEFHAWLNPYRISTNGTTSQYVGGTIPAVNPVNDSSNLLQSGNSIILNPGIASNRDFIVDTCMEVVENYNVDAIHFDDYFYIEGVETDKTANWKREQVNLFIEDLSNNLRAYNETNNKTVQLGISPSGIYQNGSYKSSPTYDANGNLTSPTYSNTSGFAHYGEYLYSDTLKWINEEWIDYIMPQVYWSLEQTAAQYGELTKWWSWATRYKKVNLYIGMGIYMPTAGNTSWQKNTYEIKDQVLNGSMYDEIGGFSMYSYNYLTNTNTYIKTGMDILKNDYWKTKIPGDVKKYYADKLDTIDVKNIKQENDILTFDKQENVRGYIIYKVEKDQEVNIQDLNQVYYYGTENEIALDDVTNYDYYVSTVNLANEISTPLTVTPDPVYELNLYKKNLSYSSELHILYAINYHDIDIEQNQVKMLFFDEDTTNFTKGNETLEIKPTGKQTISNTNCLIFKSVGIAAKDISKKIYARCYATINDEIIYSDVITYSVTDYYNEMKASSNLTTNLENLLDAMLEYGNKAEINFTENQTSTSSAQTLNISSNNSLEIYKKNLSYSSELYILYAVKYTNINVGTNPIKMLFFTDSTKDLIKGSESLEVETSGKVTIQGNTCLVFKSEGLAAKELTKDIYARAYTEIDGKLIYSEPVKYSALDYYYEMQASQNITTNLKNLLDALINYGTYAQINFDYLPNRLANKSYYEINVVNGTLQDNFTYGRYNQEETITLTPNTLPYMKFMYWQDENSNIISYEQTLIVNPTASKTYEAVFKEVTTLGSMDEINIDAQYNEDIENINIPNYITASDTKLDVTWELSSYDPTQIGKQTIYGTLVDQSITLESDVKLTINVLPYTLEYDETTASYAVLKYYGSEETLTIKDSCNNIPITKTSDSSFYGITTLKEVILPEGLTEIGAYTFQNCSNITSITFPKTLTKIGTYAFSMCNNFTTTYYDGTIEDWCNITFDSEFSNPMYYANTFKMKNENNEYAVLTSIQIPDTITEIKDFAFRGFRNVITVTLSNNITKIGTSSFRGCTSLNTIYLSSKLQTIGDRAFYNCGSLKTIYNLSNLSLTKGSTNYGYVAYYATNIYKSI